MKILSYIKNFLEVGTKQSSMRLSLLWGMILLSLLILSIAVSIIMLATSKNEESVDWTGLALLITSLSTFAGVFLYFKKEQSKTEQ